MIWESFIRQVKDLGYLVKLDTNGTFPRRLKELVGKKLLDYVAMDIKNSPEKYGETVGIPGFDTGPVEESVRFLLTEEVDYEFRTTVVREFHQAEDMVAIAKWIKGAKRYFLQSFADSGDLLENGLSAYDKDEMESFKKLLSDDLPYVMLRGV